MALGEDTFRVLYDFEAMHDSELSIAAHETVLRVSEEVEDGWILVRRTDGRTGHVPIDYLEVLKEPLLPNTDNLPSARSYDKPARIEPSLEQQESLLHTPSNIPDQKIFTSIRQMDAVGTTTQAPRVPVISATVQAETYDELLSKNHFFFSNLKDARLQFSSKLNEMVGSLASRSDMFLEESKVTSEKIAAIQNRLEDEKVRLNTDAAL